MLYHINLKPPIPFIPYQFGFEKNAARNRRQFIITYTNEMINPEFRDWLYSRNLFVTEARFFGTNPNTSYSPHIDGPKGVGDLPKICITKNSFDAKMTWYKSRAEGSERINQSGDCVTDYNNVEPVYTADVNDICLMNGGVVHNSSLGPNNDVQRFCYSMFLGDSKTKNTATWQQAVEALSPWLV